MRVSVRLPRPTEVDVLVEAEFHPLSARRLPVKLIDDLFDVRSKQRFDDLEHPSIEPKLIEHRIDIGRPLDKSCYSPEVRIWRCLEEYVLVPKAFWMGDGARIESIEGARYISHFFRPKYALHDRITEFLVVIEIRAIESGTSRHELVATDLRIAKGCSFDRGPEP